MVVSALERAWARQASFRERLAAQGTDAYRFFAADGVVIDRYGSVAVIAEHADSRVVDASVGRWLVDKTGVTSVYHKRLDVDRSNALAGEALYSATPLAGDPAPARVTASEYGVRFLIEPYGGFSTGLFLESRLQPSDAARTMLLSVNILNIG